MRTTPISLFAAVVLGAVTAARADDAVLSVAYAGKSQAYTLAGLAALRHQDVSLMDPHEKKSHTYSGVPVRRRSARGLPTRR